MRKLYPDSYVPSLLRCLYPYILCIYKYIYVHTTDDNRQKLTAERAAIVDSRVETVNSHCTKHNVLLRCFDSFLRQNPIPVPFDIHVPSFLPLSALLRCWFCRWTKRSFLITRVPIPWHDERKLFGQTVQNANGPTSLVPFARLTYCN